MLKTEGEIFDMIKAELEKIHLELKAVWFFDPIEAYNQGAGPETGKKIA